MKCQALINAMKIIKDPKRIENDKLWYFNERCDV